MQLSLIDEVPELSKKYFLDIFAETIYDANRNRMRLLTINGQLIPASLKVSCPTRFLCDYPEGTIFKLDARLIRRYNAKPYFVAVNRKSIQRAVEYFEYNLKVQYGFDYVPPTKRATLKKS